MKAWFESLALRERITLAGGGAVVVVVLLYLVVVEPMAEARSERVARVAALEREVEWMRGAATEVRRLQQYSGGVAANGSRPPYLVLDRALGQAGLPSPRKLEPVGSSGARLELEEVAFDRLIGMLGALRNDAGLQVKEARFKRVSAGVVEASVTLERGE